MTPQQGAMEAGMGRIRGPYIEDFPVGTRVTIVDRNALESFSAEHKGHHPIEATQLGFAGRTAQVKTVAFYHGGDELYELEGIPGVWHERCLAIAIP